MPERSRGERPPVSFWRISLGPVGSSGLGKVFLPPVRLGQFPVGPVACDLSYLPQLASRSKHQAAHKEGDGNQGDKAQPAIHQARVQRPRAEPGTERTAKRNCDREWE